MKSWINAQHHLNFTQSRITKLPDFVPLKLGSVYLKRDDEISFLASGNKFRKLASLIPALKSQGVEVCGLMGGWNSNSLLAAVSLLKEFGFEVHCFVWGRRHTSGNAALLGQLIADHEVTIVEDIAPPLREHLCLTTLQRVSQQRKFRLLPEGLVSPEAVVGAKTLGAELLPCTSDYIFIDAGTGVSAAGLILGLQGWDYSKNSRVIVVTMAEKVTEMTQKIEELISLEIKSELASSAITACLPNSPARLPNWEVIPPTVGRSFGSTPASVLTYCKYFTQKYGVLIDPIYMAKLLMTAEAYLKTYGSEMCQSVVIHSGGGHSLHGFL